MGKDKELKQYSWLTTKIYSFMLLFYKNTFVVDYFMKKIDKSKEILEIGSGTGKDFKTLSKEYKITGSDYSEAFLKSLKKKYRKHQFLKINALTMETGKKYDVIYSNKVLQHLTPDQLEKSLLAQYEILKKGGVLFHALWKGNLEDGKFDGIPDVLYEREDIEKIKGHFVIEEYIEYTEMKDNDSFIIILRKWSDKRKCTTMFIFSTLVEISDITSNS